MYNRIKLAIKLTRGVSIVLLLVTGGAAIFGGGSMLIDPSGNKLGLSSNLLKSSPFDSYFIPGLVLFLTVGVSSITTAVLALLENAYSARLTVLQGAVLICWIVVQAFLLQMLDPIQVVVGVTGFTLFCLGVLQASEDSLQKK
jgi:hypothetical protein